LVLFNVGVIYLQLLIEGIPFPDAFLLEEDPLKSPSPALAAEDYIGETQGVLWLVEKRHPSSMQCWSGTLNHFPAQTDLQSLTIYAFTHLHMDIATRL
jgi:hypothetical protein